MSQARSVSWSSTTSRRGQYLLLSSGTRAGSPQLPPRYRARALLAARAAMRGRCFRSQLRLSPRRAHGVRSRASPIAGAAQRLKNECASSSRSALQARLCRLPPPDAADRDRDYAKRTVKKASARPCATPLRLSFARVCQPPCCLRQDAFRPNRSRLLRLLPAGGPVIAGSPARCPRRSPPLDGLRRIRVTVILNASGA